MGIKKTIIIIGGAHGGPNAASFARLANENANIILIEQAPMVTWVQPNLGAYLNDHDHKLDQSLRDKERYFKLRYNIDVRTNTKALALDLDSKVVSIECESRVERLAFDSLVFAGGATCRQLDVAGLYGPRVINYRNLFDAAAIKKAWSSGAKRALVVGCGFYGVEAALGLKTLGFDVAIIESKKRIMPKFSLAFANIMQEKITSLGIDIKLDCTIKKAQELKDKSFSLELSSGQILETDLVVVCIGLEARSSFLSNAGAGLDSDGLVRVDEHMATTLPNVYACGSAVAVTQAITLERKWNPEPSIIMRSAQVAGLNAALDLNQEKRQSLKPFCGTLISQIGGVIFARTGLEEYEAKHIFGEENVDITTVYGSSCEQWIADRDMCLRLLVLKTNNRIIGGEVFGENGVLRRIDLISMCVLEGWSADRLIDFDMAYFADAGTAFDILKEAALRAKNNAKGGAKTISAEKLALWLASNRDFNLVNVSDTPLLNGVLAKKCKNIPLEHLRDRLDEIVDAHIPVVIYSKSGYRSYLASQALNQRGMTNVYHLDGGLATLKLITVGNN